MQSGIDEAVVVHAAKLAGLSEAEHVELVALPRIRRIAAVKRMDALLAWERARRGRGGGGIEEFASRAGLSPLRFRDLAQRWRQDRSLAALGVFDRKQQRKGHSATASVRAEIERVMRDLVMRCPDIKNAAVFREVRLLHKSATPSDATLVRWLKAARLLSAPKRAVGEIIVFDIAPIAAVEDASTQHDIAALVDVGTGLIFGAARATGRSTASAYAAAADDAVRRLDQIDLRRAQCAEAPFGITETVPAEDPMAMFRLMNRDPNKKRGRVDTPTFALRSAMSGLIGKLKISDQLLPARTYSGGYMLPSVTGHRTQSSPKSAERNVADLWPIITAEELDRYVTLKVDEHNDRVVRRFPRGREGEIQKAFRQALKDRLTDYAARTDLLRNRGGSRSSDPID